MDVGVTKLELPDRSITILDSPGHKDFIPNMLSGASQADVAVLVVDASIGGFESGFDNNGQTREHAILLRSLGIKEIIVAVNKLDNVEWSKDRFDEISERTQSFLVQIGFRQSAIYFVPVSGLSGENLTVRSDGALSAWYSGPTLLECLCKSPKRGLIELTTT